MAAAVRPLHVIDLSQWRNIRRESVRNRLWFALQFSFRSLRMTSALSDVAIRHTASPTATYLRASGGVERAIAAGPETLGRIGSLETRLVRDGDELRAAQSIRFKVFYEELGAH
ncbi:MAG TPA: hypothetical protein PKE65_06670, partial [Rhizobiaceae bacterium]|nr:hypothetical protein [Rhizobiaceae bacterium]